MTEHDSLFLKSTILSYELHSFFRYFRYLILKLEKSKQPVTKYIETTTFCKSLSLPLPPTPPLPFHSCIWVCKLHQEHDADKLLTHDIDIEERKGGLHGAMFRFLEGKPQ